MHRYLLMLAGPRSHGLGTIPAHGPNAPATENTHARILPAASCHQPAHTALSQVVTRREHAQSAQGGPATRSLALPLPPMLTASCGYVWAMIGGPEGGGNSHLVPIRRLKKLGHDERSQRSPIKGRIRVFAVPIEPLTGGCRTLLAHGDRGVKTDAASAIRPAGSPTSAQMASHDGPAAPKAAPPALWSTTRGSSKALSQPPLAHRKGGASGRRGWRTRSRPARRSALHYALSRRVGRRSAASQAVIAKVS